MPKFVALASKTDKGRTISAEEGQERRKLGIEMIHDAGGEIESLYYGSGRYDFVAILDMPDANALGKFQMAYESLGLMTVESYEVFDSAAWDQITEDAPV